jgi:hypothetical protein
MKISGAQAPNAWSEQRKSLRQSLWIKTTAGFIKANYKNKTARIAAGRF